MSDIAITFTPDGTGRTLYTEVIDLAQLGRLSIDRATNIEFDNTAQCWRVYDPAGLPLFNAPTRELCLAWEAEYLGKKEDQKHELPLSARSVAAGA